jgi:hypothetical protein
LPKTLTRRLILTFASSPYPWSLLLRLAPRKLMQLEAAVTRRRKRMTPPHHAEGHEGRHRPWTFTFWTSRL